MLYCCYKAHKIFDIIGGTRCESKFHSTTPTNFPTCSAAFRAGLTAASARSRFLYRSIKTQLTQRQRQMMELRYFQGLSIPQIAQELRVNKSTVSRTINRALSRLRELADVYFDE